MVKLVSGASVRARDAYRSPDLPRPGNGHGGITVVHPNRHMQLELRAGEDAKGLIGYYEPVNSGFEWHRYRLASEREASTVRAQLEAGLIVRKGLPSGGNVFFTRL